MSKKFYLTTTLPYVNSSPHLGHALEFVQADTIIRFQKQLGNETFFNTGTDEHGKKIYQKAVEAGKTPKQYCDEYAEKFKQIIPALGISEDINFIRTTDEHHIKAAQEFWKLCDKNGDIYKKNYQVKYCVGCELEKTESDLDENGRCLVHPHLEVELVDEENYFFKWSKYQQPLLNLYEKHKDFVLPEHRLTEIKKFVESGLQDFSISRLKEKMPWGIPVPGDETQVMYVWFDALINYVSTLGWNGLANNEQTNLFIEFWGTKENPNAIQIAGKDNLRQQSAMWQAMLMSAGLPNSKQIIIHGFINSGGQKMSKSLGNVADPYGILEKLQSLGLTKEQATDALRYYLLREIPSFEDGDYTWERFVEVYNSDLANGVGNLTSRVLKMAFNGGVKKGDPGNLYYEPTQELLGLYDNYELNKIIKLLNSEIKALDQEITLKEPFRLIKSNSDEAKKIISKLLNALNFIAVSLQPFLPHTSEQILKSLNEIKLENIPRLFPRI